MPRNRGNRNWVRERNRHADGHYGTDARAITVVEIVDMLEDEQSANSEDHGFSKDEEFGLAMSAVAPASDDEQSDSDNESFSMLTSSNPSTFLLWSKDADKG